MNTKVIENVSLENPSRRRFLVQGVTATAGLTLGVWIAPQGKAMVDAPADGAEPTFEPNAFVRIGTDNRVTVVSKHLEMGQGTYTGMATLVAEELDAAWDQVEVVGAPADAKRYSNLAWGPVQGTGGSTAIANAFEQMRLAGATARQMLLGAAAERWQVPSAELVVGSGVVSHPPSDRRATFGELAADAARQHVPDNPPLKDPQDFKLIGTRVPRVDGAAKVAGTARFTQDVHLPGMLVAVIAHPPRFGARVRSFDPASAKQVKGVVTVVEVPSGVAVLASDFWTAKKGRDALAIDWDETDAMSEGSAEIMERFAALAMQPGMTARSDGDADRALASADMPIEAEFRFPYLAHAALEPMNCVVQLGPDGCEVFNGEQFQTIDRQAVAGALGIPAERVALHMLYAGGSFGRRANPASDYVIEAAQIAKAVAAERNGEATVKLVWTREDDMRAGWYRPAYVHRMAATLGEDGLPLAWRHRIVGQSIIDGTAFASALIRDGVDHTSVEGAANLPYAIPNLRVELHSPKLAVPVQWWRSVGSTHTAFATETFMDELAARAGRDPLEYRRALLKDHPRHLGVLNLAAEKAGWGSPLPAGRGRGIAVHESFNSYVAQVAEVTVDGEGGYTVDRVVIAVDCGIAVNPDNIVAQMEGGMGFGLSAALASEITIEKGATVQSNFHNYLVLRLSEMPQVEVHIVPSSAAPTGVGEPATPVIAPAVANALYAATGQRLYRLPLKLAA